MSFFKVDIEYCKRKASENLSRAAMLSVVRILPAAEVVLNLLEMSERQLGVDVDDMDSRGSMITRTKMQEYVWQKYTRTFCG